MRIKKQGFFNYENMIQRVSQFMALFAAVYVVLTVSLWFMSYGGIQFRIAEA